MPPASSAGKHTATTFLVSPLFLSLPCLLAQFSRILAHELRFLFGLLGTLAEQEHQLSGWNGAALILGGPRPRLLQRTQSEVSKYDIVSSSSRLLGALNSNHTMRLDGELREREADIMANHWAAVLHCGETGHWLTHKENENEYIQGFFCFSLYLLLGALCVRKGGWACVLHFLCREQELWGCLSPSTFTWALGNLLHLPYCRAGPHPSQQRSQCSGRGLLLLLWTLQKAVAGIAFSVALSPGLSRERF